MNKKQLKQYFTKTNSINLLMGSLLGNVENKTLLEPSIGAGDLLNNLIGNPKNIVGYDIDATPWSNSVYVVNNKIKFKNKCFIESSLEKKDVYDCVIANPPYGLNFSLEYRKKLKKLLPKIHIKESYIVFLYLSLEQLKTGGRYVFLIPDSILFSHYYKTIREYLIKQARPTHILRMPSNSFDGLNFKYGNLCILAGVKEPLKTIHKIEWGMLNKDNDEILTTTGSKLLNNNIWSDYYLNHKYDHIREWNLLGDIAYCVTGIYTGNNEKYLGYDNSFSNRKNNGHEICWEKDVKTSFIDNDEKINGIHKEPYYIPFIRGGHRNILERASNAILWSKEAVNHYKTDSKARYQNYFFYFNEGISLPKVCSNKISASYMNNCVFDQGVVGVFPKDMSILNALLLYLNSDIASKIMKSIVNNSTANGANYLKKLPIPKFNEDTKIEANKIINSWRSFGVNLEDLKNWVDIFIKDDKLL